ncbi:MAG: hypothetical protein R3C42_08410 [Parvularculaceae bacterium]|nr:hypothetical protein [Parvularculaceae bacterium]
MDRSPSDIRAPIRAGDTVSDEDAERIFARVTACTLARSEWTHPAHLVFAAVLLQREGLAGAERKMPDMIRAYNISVGTPNNDSEGYHHTITLFFLRRIDAFFATGARANMERARGVGADATRLVASPLADPEYLLAFYTKERLFSLAARRAWVGPDLEPSAD